MNFKKFLSLSLALIFWSGSSFAGQEGHGGHVVRCPNQAPVVLEYFIAALPKVGAVPARIFVQADGSFIDFVHNKLKKTNAADSSRRLADILFRFESEVGPIEQWHDYSLPLLTDHRLPIQILGPCEILQAAIRQGGMQFGNKNVIRELSTFQKEILRLHEILFAYVQSKGSDSPIPVRELIIGLLNVDLDQRALNSAIVKFFKKVDDSTLSWSCAGSCWWKNDFGQLQQLPRVAKSDRANDAYQNLMMSCAQATESQGQICNAPLDSKTLVCAAPITFAQNCVLESPTAVEEKRRE